MASVFKKSIVWGLLVVTAFVTLYFVRRYRDSLPEQSEFSAVLAHDVWSNLCMKHSSDVTLPIYFSPISFTESTSLLGKDAPSKTFSLSVADINGDGRDDILIGAHENNPYLFINSGTGFTDESPALFAEGRVLDRHGYTFADLDNDGDLDLAVASGGQDGVGAGAPNLFLKNVTENGVLHFSEEKVSAEMREPASRSRSFIPIASPDGKAVDLYLTTLLRKGFPNRLFRNARLEDHFLFEPEQNFLTVSINDHGRGAIADFNGNGNNDYLVIDDSQLKIIWDPDSGRSTSTLANNALSTEVGDFNNDGLLDIFVGRISFLTKSDNLTNSSNELIYVIRKSSPDDTSSISFKTKSSKIEFDLDQHIPATIAKGPVGARNIFLGRKKINPKTRKFTLGRKKASDEPESFDSAGIYIWYSPSSKEWSMKWIFHDAFDEFKGIVNGVGISNVIKKNFLVEAPLKVSDTVLVNQGNGMFSELCTALPQHQGSTSGSTIADFNNDGWLDIIGVHQPEQGLPNGKIFVLTNNSGKSFTSSLVGLREKDRLHRLDLIAHGFFNDDEKPDLVITNGFGQIPGTNGSPLLMLNNTQEKHQAILVRLQGTNSNKFGIGAKLTLTDAKNDIIGYRVQGLNTNISQDTYWMHFGLGDFPAPYSLKIDWPDNTTTNTPFNGPGNFTVKQ